MSDGDRASLVRNLDHVAAMLDGVATVQPLRCGSSCDVAVNEQIICLIAMLISGKGHKIDKTEKGIIDVRNCVGARVKSVERMMPPLQLQHLAPFVMEIRDRVAKKIRFGDPSD